VPPKVKVIGDWIVRLIVVGSVAWTAICIAMTIRHHYLSAPNLSSEDQSARPTITLPTLSSSELYQNLPGIQEALLAFEDSANQPVRLSVVYQSDSTCYIELTYVSDCGCMPEKLDRYTILHRIVDPVLGTTLTEFSDASLSAERLDRYFGGLTQIRRFK
jgi:hypothetical protein